MTYSRDAAELDFLRNRVKELECRLEFLENHRTLAAGIRGETLVSSIIDGKLTAYSEPFDVTASTGELIEVKKSSLKNVTKNSSTKRWQWGRVFGVSGKKNYDYMILVGDKDSRYSDKYIDQSSPYVIFCVPLSEVSALTSNGDTIKTRSIFLTSNPDTALRSAAGPLFTRYQVSAEFLADRFGL